MKTKNQNEETDIIKENEQRDSEISAFEKMRRLYSDLPDVDEHFDEIVEAVLFAAGHAVKYSTIANMLDRSEKEIKEKITNYAEKYNNSKINRGVSLYLYDDSCQLATKHEYLPYIRAALGIRRSGNLSPSSIETLAIIAYQQPITRPEIDSIRKVDSSYAVSSLVERGLIEYRGRKDVPGRPMLYGTTPDFLRCFGISSLSELPAIMTDEGVQNFELINKQLRQNEQIDENQLTFDESIPEEHVEDIEIPGTSEE